MDWPCFSTFRLSLPVLLMVLCENGTLTHSRNCICIIVCSAGSSVSARYFFTYYIPIIVSAFAVL